MEATNKPAVNRPFGKCKNTIGVSTEYFLKELRPKIKEGKQKVKDLENELARARWGI